MVVEQLIPAAVVADVEQAGSRAAEALALSSEGFGGALLEEIANLAAEFFLFRRVGEVHGMLRLIRRLICGFVDRRTPKARYQTMRKRETTKSVSAKRATRSATKEPRPRSWKDYFENATP